MRRNRRSSHGFALVELLIGISIMVVSILSLIAVYSALSTAAYENTAKLQAVMLADEGVEAIKTIRDFGWASRIQTLSTTTTYRLYWSNSQWVATTAPVMIDSTFDRTFTLSDVQRDGVFNIVSSGGTYDAASKKARVTVSWNAKGATTSKAIDFYLFNVYNN